MAKPHVFWTTAQTEPDLEAMATLYIRPAIERDPLGMAYLLYGEHALKALVGDSAPLVRPRIRSVDER